MIKSEIIKIKKIENFDNIYVEHELAKRFSSVIRWAITDIDDEFLKVCVSHE